jgi:hypothetical protein
MTTTTTAVSARKVISLNFERSHWSQWIGPSGDAMNSLI